MKTFFTISFSLLLIAGCGSTPAGGDAGPVGSGDSGPAVDPITEFAATYIVTATSENPTGCTAGGPIQVPDVYFQLRPTEPGANDLGYYSCETDTRCDNTPVADKSLVIVDGVAKIDAYVGVDVNPSTCAGVHTVGTITRTANGARIEIRTYRGEFPRPMPDGGYGECNEAVARANASVLTNCDSFLSVEGRRLGTR